MVKSYSYSKKLVKSYSYGKKLVKSYSYGKKCKKNFVWTPHLYINTRTESVHKLQKIKKYIFLFLCFIYLFACLVFASVFCYFSASSFTGSCGK